MRRMNHRVEKAAGATRNIEAWGEGRGKVAFVEGKMGRSNYFFTLVLVEVLGLNRERAPSICPF